MIIFPIGSLREDKLTSLKESGEFLLKNFVDALTIHGTTLEEWEKKLKLIEKEFDMRYEITPEVVHAMNRCVKNMLKDSKNQYEPVDVIKLDKFHHLKALFDAENYDASLNDLDLPKFYLILYKMYSSILSYDSIPGWFSKYILPYFLDGKYVVYISFDEKAVHNVVTFASENQFDLWADSGFYPLKFNYKIFKKQQID